MPIGSWFDRLKARFPGRLKRDEYFIEVCPYCGNPKRNFQVNVELLVVHCWSCDVGGTVRGLFRDFDLPLDDLPDTPSGRREALEREEEEIKLPEEAQDVLTSSEIGSNWAFDYLTKNRRMTREEIVSYGLKFAISGSFTGRVIFPLFEGSELIYFVARKFMKVSGRTYMYPGWRRRNLLPIFLGEDHRMDLVLVEGVFEVPPIKRLGYSVMPLLGKALTPEQVRKLERRRFERYIVLLDHDSVSTAVEMAERLREEGLRGEYTFTGGVDSDELARNDLSQVLESARPPSLLGRISAKLGRV